MIAATTYRTARREFFAAPAAPAGGARPQGRGRGRGFGLSASLPTGPSVGLSVGLVVGVAAAAAQTTVPVPTPVPSGQQVYLQEVLLDDAPSALWVRFRFVAPGIGRNAGDIGYDVSAVDMDHLCTNLALPYLTERGLRPARVVISLADRELPFGVSDPEATQFFEAYRAQGERCIWEEF